MTGVPVKTSMSPLEIAAWGSVYARVITNAAPSQRSSHATIADAIAAADRAVIDLRDALGAEHLSLRLAELGNDDAAKLDVFREHLTRGNDGGR